MPDDTISKGGALAAIERERDAWETLLGRIGEARMLEPGVFGEWSFKDLVAHLNGWDLESLGYLEASALGREEPAQPWPDGLDDEDAINRWLVAQGRDRLLGEVIGDSRETFARLAGIVQRLPDDAFADPGRFPTLDGMSLAECIVEGRWFGHFREEHLPDVERWLSGA